eukprot:jgi/Tetstr1/460670/TSEL_005866.t1
MGILGNGSPAKEVVTSEAGPTMKFLTNDKQAPAFPLSKEKMIELVKDLVKHKFGSQKPELLADDFQFRFPIIELGKEEFVKAFGSFKLDQAFPDMVTEYYGFRLDPHIPGRIWYDTIGGGTHTGPMGGPFKRVKPTGKTISLPPQTSSMTFNEQGQLTYFTGGYVVDRRMGNTGGLGGVFGILHGIGYTLPFPEGKPFSLSWRFRFFRFMGKFTEFISGLLFGKSKSE